MIGIIPINDMSGSFLLCSETHPVCKTFLDIQTQPIIFSQSQADTVFPKQAFLICLTPCYIKYHPCVC